MKEVRIYIEGGGSDERTKRPLRAGFHQFFRGIVTAARQKRISFMSIVCGSREATIDLFSRAVNDHSQALNFLLIDSDLVVSTVRADHVKTHFHRSLSNISEDRCHLMVQVMEAWFLADPAKLKEYYGKDFHSTALPGSNDVEDVEKDNVLTSLKHATRHTSKGEYHKIKHASELLKLVRPELVRKASRHCDVLFQTLESQIQAVG